MKAMSSQKLYSCRSLKQSGSVLVAAVWILALFSILSAGLFRIVASCLNISTRIERGGVCRQLARSACVLAQAQETQDQTGYDTLYEFSQKQSRQIDNLSFEFVAEDESGKININICSKQALSKLPGLDDYIAEKIIASELRPYAAKEELLDVEGITSEVYKGLESFITVHGDGSININTAGLEVLYALGVDEALITTLIDFRAGEDEKEGTEDDAAFEDVADIVPQLKSRGIALAQEAVLVNLINQGLLRVDSQFRALKITAAISAKAVDSYTVILDADRIIQWKEL